MRISQFLFAGAALAQEFSYSEYSDYNYNEEPATTEAAAATTEQATTARPLVGEEETVQEPQMAMDAVETFEEEPEEGPGFDPRMMNSFGQVRNAVVPYVSDINNMDAELQANGDIMLSWDYDATHDAYIFDYVTIIGNSENTTDYQTLAGVTIGLNGDNTKTQATFTPGATNTVYKVRVTPQDNDLNDAVANYQEIEVQSATTAVTHQPGAIYMGGSGFVGQVLLVNDFTHASYQRADAGDAVGHVTAVKVTFPSACTNIRIDANVDNSYIYTDDAITDTHRIFVFPQTHFTNQLSGPVKAFRYYVSNMYGCVTDPAVDVTVTTSNEYLTVDSLTADGTTSPQNVTLTAMWPIGGAYPPTDYAELHAVWFDQLIQGATHLGPSTSLSAPIISFSTAPCNVYVSVVGEADAGGNGYSPGWGYNTNYDANLAMTDLASNPGTSNYGSAFVFRALEWMNHIGVSIRYSISDADCQIVNASGTISYIKLNPAYSLTTAVNPDQNA